MTNPKTPPPLRELQDSLTPQEPETLGNQIRQWRERRMLTPEHLAKKSLVPVRLIEDLEGGIELFLSPSIRQRIARALQVRPSQIQELEKISHALSEDEPSANELRRDSAALHAAILQDPDAPQICPACSAALSIRLFTRRDLQNQPLTVVKASCTACLFRLSDD